MADDKKNPEDSKDAGAAQPTPAGSGKKKIIIIIVVVVLLLAVAGGAAAFVMLKAKSHQSLDSEAGDAGHTAEVPEGHSDEDELDEGEEAIGAIFPMDPIVVNLHGGGLIRCQIQLEFSARDIPGRFYTNLVPVRDALIELLSGKRKEDVLAVDGKSALKNSIRELINNQLRKEDITKVYFTQYVVQ